MIVDVVFVLASVIFNPAQQTIEHKHVRMYQTRDECRADQAVVEGMMRTTSNGLQYFLTECTAIPVRKIERE